MGIETFFLAEYESYCLEAAKSAGNKVVRIEVVKIRIRLQDSE